MWRLHLSGKEEATSLSLLLSYGLDNHLHEICSIEHTFNPEIPRYKL